MATVLGRALGTAVGRPMGSALDIESLFLSVLALSTSLFSADLVGQDPISFKVARIYDQRDTSHYLEQTNQANQVAMPAGHADFAGRLCLTFAGAEWYQSNRPAAQWASWHNGTDGAEAWLVCTPTEVAGDTRPVSTRATGATNGFNIHWANTPAFSHFVSSTTSAAYINYNTGGTGHVPVVGTPTYVSVSYLTTRAQHAQLYVRGNLVNTSSAAGTPSAAASAGSLVWGGSTAGANLAKMRSPALLLPRALSEPERALNRQYIQQAYGIAA